MKGALDKVKLIDTGVKNKYGNLNSECSKSSTAHEDRIYYPNLYLDLKEAPMLTGSEVGEEVTLLVKAKIISHSLNDNLEHKNESFSLEIRKLGVVSTKN